jgi:hypothetical protein
MIILKHVEYIIKDTNELNGLLDHLKETTSRIEGVELMDIYFPKGKDEFILMMNCVNEYQYLKWREICPPPPGAKDWYEVLLDNKDHVFK